MSEAPKISLSLGKRTTKKKSSKSSSNNISVTKNDFGGDEDNDLANQNNTDLLPQEPLIIPALQDTRQSLQEQARKRREQQPTQNATADDDAAAAAALEQEAAKDNNKNTTGGGSGNGSSTMVIQGQENTFVRGGGGGGANEREPSSQDDTSNNDKDKEQLHKDLSNLAEELDVEDETYRKVPITDFGAAMLRGMGWTGQVSTREEDPSMPRPSRLGLGATPKLLDAPTHGRRPRRQDQVERERKLKEQQEVYAKEKAMQIKLDKQRTLQIGSIVQVINDDGRRPRRAIMRQLQGVPGLNRVLVQFEGEAEPTKVKKGDVQLLDRSELDQQPPFEEPPMPKEKKQPSDTRSTTSSRDSSKRSRSGSNGDDEDRKRSKKEKRRRDDKYDDERRQRRRDRDRDDRSRDHKRHRGDRSRDRDDRDRKRDRKDDSHRSPSTWVIPNIRVRVISQKLGKSVYKQKGVVVDVSHKGTATLNMDDGQVIHCPERYLETALPKAGGNAVCLAGMHRYAKGKLLERDSKTSKGVIQLYEDMDVVTLSLDDMAEYCGPLDDDLME